MSAATTTDDGRVVMCQYCGENPATDQLFERQVCWRCWKLLRDQAAAAAEVNEAAEALDAARVDLVRIIREGIPPRRYVPGCEPWLIAGKRYLVPASAGTGKTLAALVTAVEVVASGGTVAILDVENGGDEYAARLKGILADRDPEVVGACQERLRYYAWPSLSTKWDAEQWAAAHAGVDLVVFDSSRLTLSSVGLKEDSNDDYAKFVDSLLIPLSRAQIATVTLDNAGWEDRERARGASSKHDLNEVVYLAKVAREFDSDRTGELRLIRKRQRFSGLPAVLALELGGGRYRAPVPVEPGGDDERPFRPTNLMQKLSAVCERQPGLGRDELLALVAGKGAYKSQALQTLITEGYIRQEADGKTKRHHSVMPYRELEDEC